MTHPLPLTGERTLPGVAGEEYWFARHEAAYAWLAGFAELAGARVLEAGSGEGYGAALLRRSGADVVLALEYDAPSARHAAQSYPDVTTVRANLAAVPVAARAVDVLVSLQVVEHLWDLREFLRDCTRVVRPGGLVVVTTPNRPVFSPGLGRGERPTNPFHVEEFDAEQLADLLRSAGLVDVEVLGLHHGERIRAWESGAGTGIVAAQVAVVTGTGRVPDDLADVVAGITAADFEVGAADGSQDLLALARTPVEVPSRTGR